MEREKVRTYDNAYCKLRNMQFAAYEFYARQHALTAKELFVLDILWFAPDGCLQSDICSRLSATKQTISAIVKKFLKQGYVTLEESSTDRRNKIVRFTEAGLRYAEEIIPPAAKAEVDALAELSDEDITELVRITTLFSCHMKQRFDALNAQASTTLDIYAHAFDKNKRKAQEKLGKAIGL